ncbi:TOPRIM nucleotidyl transferase/hydrolase domain-containing protein [Kineococcus sp. SYSU DK004]|uniref:TOPRIM nucleotidyl transferase/hydrolase domain-containing protein n=1 Tax=Kineococcus sp. SYSU DK004 TaxID=3383125 RepID=UPI003D7D8BFD
MQVDWALVAAGAGTSANRARAAAAHLPPDVRAVAGAPRAVLVEGATDRAVLGVLLQRTGSGVPVVAAGGKQPLRLAHALLRAAGTACHVVVDGDARGWTRAGNRSRARAVHRRQTAAVLAWLPGAAGLAPGAPTTTTATCTVWHDDLEGELEEWPSFTAALLAAGGEPRCKDAARYAAAAAAAAPQDLPAGLRALLAAVTAPPADGPGPAG